MLKNEKRMKKLNINKHKRKALKHQAKFYRLSFLNELNHLCFIEATKASSICLIEKKISRYLKTVHENHEHYVNNLTLNYLIKQAY